MLYLDTNILIYLLEQHGHYSTAVASALEDFSKHDKAGVFITSTITIVEFLAGTTSSNLGTLQQVPRLQFIALDESLAEQAAKLQRKDQLQIGDAIHLATAIQQHADVFFTNDKPLAKVVSRYMTPKGL